MKIDVGVETSFQFEVASVHNHGFSLGETGIRFRIKLSAIVLVPPLTFHHGSLAVCAVCQKILQVTAMRVQIIRMGNDLIPDRNCDLAEHRMDYVVNGCGFGGGHNIATLPVRHGNRHFDHGPG